MKLQDLRNSCEQHNNSLRSKHIQNYNLNNEICDDEEERGENDMSNSSCNNNHQSCSQLPGTILRIFIPAGAVINLLNIFEVTSPTGICLIIRLPLLGGEITSAPQMDISGITNFFKKFGASVEVANE